MLEITCLAGGWKLGNSYTQANAATIIHHTNITLEMLEIAKLMPRVTHTFYTVPVA